MTFNLRELMEWCRDHPGLWQEITAAGTHTPDFLWITIPDGAIDPSRLPKPLASPKPKPMSGLSSLFPAKPRKFPLWATLLAAKKTPEDKGIGDTIARLIGPIGGDAYKRWFSKITGKPCGCEQRQDRLNALFPYS